MSRNIDRRLEKLETMAKQNGLKEYRFNLSLSYQNTDYIRVMSGIKGETMNQFINDALDADRQRNLKVYHMAKELAKEID